MKKSSDRQDYDHFIGDRPPSCRPKMVMVPFKMLTDMQKQLN